MLRTNVLLMLIIFNTKSADADYVLEKNNATADYFLDKKCNADDHYVR